MESEISALSWWSLTKRVLFSPRAFFAQLQLQEPFSYRRSLLHLAKTALVVSLLNTLVLTTIFYVIVASFSSILIAATVLFGTLLTPVIAVAGNIPPEKVPGVVESFAKSGGSQVAIFSVKLGVFLFAAYFGTIISSTCLQAGIAHCIARLLGCTGSFRSTAAVYSLGSAAWTLSLIPGVNAFAPIYGAALDIFGMQHGQGLTGAKASLAVAAAAAIPIVAFLLYSSSN